MFIYFCLYLFPPSEFFVSHYLKSSGAEVSHLSGDALTDVEPAKVHSKSSVRNV